jgi:hypothetical protein
MKAQIIRFAGTLALATALLTTTTAAFAATPTSLNPTAVYADDDDAQQEGEATAAGLDLGGAALGVGSAIVGATAGDTEGGAATAAGLGIGGTVLTTIAAPAVRFGTR